MWKNIGYNALLITVFLTFVFLLFWVHNTVIKRTEDRRAVRLSLQHAFITECMDDGKKMYECEALWGQARRG